MVELSDQFGKPYFTKGGQGKLFRDPKPIAEHRYPRGYTPERMHMVRDANFQISASPKRTQETSEPWKVRRVQEIIARSTIPEEHFPQQGQGRRSILPIKTGMSINASGQFDSMKNEIKTSLGAAVSRPEASVLSQRGAELQDTGNLQRLGHTLIHELGHYHSEKMNTPHSLYRTPEQQGEEEAYADAYKLRHFRADPRDVRRGVRQDLFKSSGGVEEQTMGYESPVTHGRGFAGMRAFASYQKKRQELAGPGVPAEVRASRQQAQRNETERAAAQEEHATHLVNSQLFHRDYRLEDQTGKPYWTANPRHIPENPRYDWKGEERG